MLLLNSFSNFIVNFAIGLLIVVSLALYFRKTSKYRILPIIFLSVSFCIFSFQLIYTKHILLNLSLFLLYVPVLLSLGPLSFLYLSHSYNLFNMSKVNCYRHFFIPVLSPLILSAVFLCHIYANKNLFFSFTIQFHIMSIILFH